MYLNRCHNNVMYTCTETLVFRMRGYQSHKLIQILFKKNRQNIKSNVLKVCWNLIFCLVVILKIHTNFYLSADKNFKKLRS